jgi:2-keto-4-pentenoate hydratase
VTHTDSPGADQDAAADARVARGETVVGVSVNGPGDITWLTDAMEIGGNRAVPETMLASSRVAPHIAFVLRAPLVSATTSAADVVAATLGVCGALEVHGDHNRTTYFRLGAQPQSTTGLDLGLLGVLLEDGVDVVETGAGAAVGHPAESVAAAARQLSVRGRPLASGMVVLSGRVTDAVALADTAGLAATFAHLGRVALDG